MYGISADNMFSHFVILSPLDCNIDGNTGDGMAQGTCSNTNAVCMPDGKCESTYYTFKNQ